MELPFQQVVLTEQNEDCQGNYWDFLMSQVRILPSRCFMASNSGSSSMEDIWSHFHKSQRRFTGDFKKQTAPRASRTLSMPKLSNGNIIDTASLNNQNINCRFGYSGGLNQNHSGSMGYSSIPNYSGIPFTKHVQRIQDFPVCRQTGVEIASGTRTDKVRIKDSLVQRKEYVTLVASDIVKYSQLPKQCRAEIYVIDENHCHHKAKVQYTEIKKVNAPFTSVPTQSIKCDILSTSEDQSVQALSQGQGDGAKSDFSTQHSYFKAQQPEKYAMPGKEIIMASTFGISPLRKVAKKESHEALPLCSNLGPAELSNQPVRNQSSFLNNTRFTTLPTMATHRNVRGSIVCDTKDKALIKHRKGFSSITITARKIISPANKSLKPVNAAISEKKATVKGIPVNTQKYFKNSVCSMHKPGHTDLKVSLCKENSSNPHSALHSGGDHESFLHINNRHPEILLGKNKDNLQLSATHPHSVLSCAHIKVLPPSSNSIYYYDKSLLLAVDLPTNNNVAGLIQKSALSLKLSCTSSEVSADGGSSTLNLISLNEMPRRKVTFIVLEKNKVKLPSVTLVENDFTQRLMSTVGQSYGDSPLNAKDIPNLPEESTDLLGSLLHINKETNKIITQQIDKCQHSGLQLAITDPNCAPVDEKIPDCHVNLNGERRDTEREHGRDSTPSMDTKSTTESPAVLGEEDKHSGLTREHEKTPLQLLTLREALELHKPDFISRSQERIQQLIHKAEQRKVQFLELAMEKNKCRGPPPEHTMSLSPTKKRQFTVPHPLSEPEHIFETTTKPELHLYSAFYVGMMSRGAEMSQRASQNNLFKPKERVIPEKEMQMRSKRIYNKLPEVKKKKEDEKKKVISQTNRLRAELFKKKLLGQILQKNIDTVQ